jgi:EmrB/QacA subfamily drug resistance transporter
MYRYYYEYRSSPAACQYPRYNGSMAFRDFTSPESKLVLLATVLSSGIGFFEATAIGIALPAIQIQFGANVTQLQWVMNAYTLILSVLILIMGSLSDRFGRKRVLLGGIFIFTLGNLISGLATDVTVLISGRLVQGWGAAMMIPQSLAIITAMYAEKTRGSAIGLWGGLSGAITVLGPFAGGFLVDRWGWESVFLVTVPVGIASMLLVQRVIPDSRLRTDIRTDWIGAWLSGIGLTLLSYALIESSSLTWHHPLIYGTAGVGMGFLALLGIRLSTATHPLIDRSVLTKREIVIANVYTFLLYAVLATYGFFASLYFQSYLGYSASQAGLAMVPLSVAITVLSFFTGSLADRYGARVPMTAGAGLVALGLVFQATGSASQPSYWLDIFPGMTLVGVGLGVFIPALTKTALSVSQEHTGSASGLNNGVSRIAGLVGVAVLGAIIVAVFREQLSQGIAELNLQDEIVESVTSQADRLLALDPGQIPEGLKLRIRAEAESAFLAAYRLQLLICAALATLGALVSAALPDKKK